jgi:hypothetical protein
MVVQVVPKSVTKIAWHPETPYAHVAATGLMDVAALVTVDDDLI